MRSRPSGTRQGVGLVLQVHMEMSHPCLHLKQQKRGHRFIIHQSTKTEYSVHNPFFWSWNFKTHIYYKSKLFTFHLIDWLKPYFGFKCNIVLYWNHFTVLDWQLDSSIKWKTGCSSWSNHFLLEREFIPAVVWFGGSSWKTKAWAMHLPC